MTTKRRVYYETDGQVRVVIPAPKSKKKNETEDEWLKRVYEKTELHKRGLLFDDVEVTDLPQDRTKRRRWRGTPGNGVIVDDTLIFADESLDNQIESEKADLPTWGQVANAIDNADTVAKLQVIVKKIARPVYTYLKKSVN